MSESERNQIIAELQIKMNEAFSIPLSGMHCRTYAIDGLKIDSQTDNGLFGNGRYKSVHVCWDFYNHTKKIDVRWNCS